MNTKSFGSFLIRIIVLYLLIVGTFMDTIVTYAQDGPPRPTMSTNGAIGKPATYRLPVGRLPAVSAAAAQSTDDWTPDFSEEFETDLTNWTVFDLSDDGLDRQWGIDTQDAYSGNQSLWVAAGGADGFASGNTGYPDNLNTWFVSGAPLDLSSTLAGFVEFHMNFDIEAEYDFVFVGVSTDGEYFAGEYWTGDSGGWNYYSVDLSSYIGEPQVYLAWYFFSDESNPTPHAGVWIDDVSVWTYVNTGPVTTNDAVINGDFERGDLSEWTVPDGSTVIVEEAPNPISGSYVAYFGGANNLNESFYQTLQIPIDADNAHVSFYANHFGEETKEGADVFCAGFYDDNASPNLVLDLGCIDGVLAFGPEFNTAGWWQVDYAITGDEWETIKGQALNLTFEMFTDDALPTTVFIDDVVFETSSGGVPSDDNDTATSATPLTPGEEVSDLAINPNLDVDYYSFQANAGETIAATIKAAANGSGLDSVIQILDSNEEVLCENDDFENSLDSYVTCSATSSGTHYVLVHSYDGSGNRNYFYSLLVQVSGGIIPPPAPQPPANSTPQPGGPDKKAWTAIIYIDGDNNLCPSYPDLITRMEQELGGRIGENGFLNIAVLFDTDPTHCNGVNGHATRYLIQPGGNYQDNVNRWDMGEVNMGDPQTLVSFAQWAMRNYPADHYYLAVDNHGGGVSGIAWDDTNDHDSITNDELYAALKQITDNGNTPIDLFAYEACLMGMFENAYDIHPFTRYIFFFPTISWTNNASYPSYLGDNRFSATSDGRALGEIVFDVYYNAVSRQPYALSLVDSSKMEALLVAVKNWADTLRSAGTAQLPRMKAARSAAQKIDQTGNGQLEEDDAYLDLWDLADKMAAQGIGIAESATVKQAVEDAVLLTNARSSQQVDYSRQKGLSIFWPQLAEGDYRNYVTHRIYTSTRNGTWDEFLTFYFGDSGTARGGMGYSYGPSDRGQASSSSESLFLPLIAR